MFIAESTSEKMFIGEYLAQLQEKAGLCCAVSSTSYTVTDPTIRQPGFHHTQLPTLLSDSQVSISLVIHGL